MQQRFDGAGTWEVEENTVLVLLNLGCHFEEGEDHGRGLGLGQRSLLECLGAEGMMQDIGGTRQQEPHGVRQEGRGGGAVAVEVTAIPGERQDPVTTTLSGLPFRKPPCENPLHTETIGGLWIRGCHVSCYPQRT